MRSCVRFLGRIANRAAPHRESIAPAPACNFSVVILMYSKVSKSYTYRRGRAFIFTTRVRDGPSLPQARVSTRPPRGAAPQFLLAFHYCISPLRFSYNYIQRNPPPSQISRKSGLGQWPAVGHYFEEAKF